MTRTNEAMEGPADFEAGRTLWQRCRTTEAPESEAERFLDLAALADGMLDEEEHDRVVARLAGDPTALADVAAARALSAGGIAMSSGIEPIVERAVAILDQPPPRARGGVALSQRSGRAMINLLAQWGSLAAAIAVASWLGFAMGSGASSTLIQPGQANQTGDENFLPELLDPSTGFWRDFSAGQQT
jgi:anti-sigma factor RsiW